MGAMGHPAIADEAAVIRRQHQVGGFRAYARSRRYLKPGASEMPQQLKAFLAAELREVLAGKTDFVFVDADPAQLAGKFRRASCAIASRIPGGGVA